MIAVPCAFMRASTANSRSISRFSSAAVGSSRMKTRHCRRSALAIATSWRSAKPSDADRPVRVGIEVELGQHGARGLAHTRAIDHGQRPEAAHRQIAERDVLRDRQRRHQAQLLRDGHDAGGDGVARARKVPRRSVDADRCRGRDARPRPECGSAWICRRRSRRRRHEFRRRRHRSRRRRARRSRRNAW